MSKSFRVWSRNGHITVIPIDPNARDGDDTHLSAAKDRYGWRVSALVQARGKTAAITAATAAWDAAGIGHLVGGDRGEAL